MFGKSKKVLKVYIPVLFKLKNDSAIIHSQLLESIKENLYTIQIDNQVLFVKNNAVKEKNNEFDLSINPLFFKQYKTYDLSLVNIQAKAFYYHHRLIYEVQLEYTSKHPKFRPIRMHLIKQFQEFSNLIVQNINATIQNAPKSFSFLNTMDTTATYEDLISNLNDIRIMTFYQYCIVFQKKIGHLKQQQQIQTFNIPTLQQKYNPFGRESILRISIPNMTAYYNGRLDKEFKSEIINTVYKTCLYKKKLQEIDKTSKLVSYDYTFTKKHLVIDESLIMKMWDYTLDSFGGKRTDQINNKSSLVSFIISLVALIISLISFLG